MEVCSSKYFKLFQKYKENVETLNNLTVWTVELSETIVCEYIGL